MKIGASRAVNAPRLVDLSIARLIDRPPRKKLTVASIKKCRLLSVTRATNRRRVMFCITSSSATRRFHNATRAPASTLGEIGNNLSGTSMAGARKSWPSGAPQKQSGPLSASVRSMGARNVYLGRRTHRSVRPLPNRCVFYFARSFCFAVPGQPSAGSAGPLIVSPCRSPETPGGTQMSGRDGNADKRASVTLDRPRETCTGVSQPSRHARRKFE